MSEILSAQDFLSELRRLIQMLPEEEIEEAVDFYTNYFYDSESEEEALKSLGSVRDVAAEIVADYALRQPGRQPSHREEMAAAQPQDLPQKKRGAFKTTMLVITAVFAAPVAIPVAIAIGASLFAVFISVSAVLIAFIVSGFALVVSGIAGIGIGVYGIFVSPVNTLTVLGTGLAATGLGYLLLRLAFFALKPALRGIGRAATSFIVKVGRKNR